MIVDRQGRLFGKVSLVDVVVIGFILSLTPTAYYAYALVVGRWQLEILDINPHTVIPGIHENLTIDGKQFDPWSQVRLGDLPYQPARFVSPRRLIVEIPMDLEAGWHDVSVRDRRNRTAVLANGFEVLKRQRLSTEVSVTCLLTGLTTEEVKRLRPSQAAREEGKTGPQVLQIYSASLKKPAREMFSASVDEPGLGKEWILASVKLIGILDRAFDPPVFFYEGQRLLTGDSVTLTLARLSVNGVITAPPALIRYLATSQ